jgi:cbb3-type cytochrome oxidase maturation protein
MNVLVYLVPAALGLGLLGLAAFLWSLRSGQYDDMDGAALRVLSDDDVATPDTLPRAAPTGRQRAP